MQRREIADVLHDRSRLRVLHDTRLLDTPPDEAFDRLTRLAARVLDVPVTFIALVDEHRDFHKSSFSSAGVLPDAQKLQGATICHLTLVSGGPVVIGDVRESPELGRLPALRAGGVRAVATIPLVVHGAVIGSFCAIDFQPREWSQTEIEALVQFGQSAVCEIELHMLLRAVEEKAAAARQVRAQLATLHEIIAHEDAGAAAGAAEAGAAPEGGRDRVLIADDDPTIRALVCRVLASDGYEMLEARDGLETIAVMRQGRPDIVLLDLKMPAMSGWEVLSLRESDAGLGRIPVIVISARRGPDVARALASGAYALLSKPFEVQALKYIVRSCLVETRPPVAAVD